MDRMIESILDSLDWDDEFSELLGSESTVQLLEQPESSQGGSGGAPRKRRTPSSSFNPLSATNSPERSFTHHLRSPFYSVQSHTTTLSPFLASEHESLDTQSSSPLMHSMNIVTSPTRNVGRRTPQPSSRHQTCNVPRQGPTPCPSLMRNHKVLNMPSLSYQVRPVQPSVHQVPSSARNVQLTPPPLCMYDQLSLMRHSVHEITSSTHNVQLCSTTPSPWVTSPARNVQRWVASSTQNVLRRSPNTRQWVTSPLRNVQGCSPTPPPRVTSPTRNERRRVTSSARNVRRRSTTPPPWITSTTRNVQCLSPTPPPRGTSPARNEQLSPTPPLWVTSPTHNVQCLSPTPSPRVASPAHNERCQVTSSTHNVQRHTPTPPPCVASPTCNMQQCSLTPPTRVTSQTHNMRGRSPAPPPFDMHDHEVVNLQSLSHRLSLVERSVHRATSRTSNVQYCSHSPPPSSHRQFSSMQPSMRRVNVRHRSLTPPPFLAQDHENLNTLSSRHPLRVRLQENILLARNRLADLDRIIDRMSYEQIITLEDRTGSVDTGTGISKLKLHEFVKELMFCSDRDEAECCIICLEDYNNGDKLGQLRCGHKYHSSCITRWIKEKTVCPVCKRYVVRPGSSSRSKGG